MTYKSIDERLTALEAVAHEPYDFRGLIYRIDALEAAERARSDRPTDSIQKSADRLCIFELEDQLAKLKAQLTELTEARDIARMDGFEMAKTEYRARISELENHLAKVQESNERVSAKNKELFSLLCEQRIRADAAERKQNELQQNLEIARIDLKHLRQVRDDARLCLLQLEIRGDLSCVTRAIQILGV